MKVIPLRNGSALLRNLNHATAFTSFARTTSKARKAARLLFSVAVLLGSGATTVRGQSGLDVFDPNANSEVLVVVLQPGGKILIGGGFTALSPNGAMMVTRNRIARLNSDGKLDNAFNPDANGFVYAIAVQADGKILVGGSFTRIGGQTRNNIARLDATTGLADSFDPNADNLLFSIVVQADGKILAGGYFRSIGGQVRQQIARLDPTTGLADSFDPNVGAGIYGLSNVDSITVQANGTILVGGFFQSIGGQPRHNIARLDATTGLADSFDPDSGGEVVSIAVQTDGKILAGGSFFQIGGQTRNFIARLDATTGLADSFDPFADEVLFSIAVQADGKILVGGGFSQIGGQLRYHIARLDPTTGLADSFDPHANSGHVNSIAVQADGKILVGGRFTSIGGQPRNNIARLRPDVFGTPTPTPTATATPTPTATVTATPAATPTGTPCPTPAAPTNLVATAISCSQIDLTWTDNANNETGFRIQRSLDGINFSFIPGVLPPNTTNYTASGLTPGTTYYFRVGALNSCGSSSNPTAASATTASGPAAPTNLGATAISSSQIALSWTDNANNETGYRVQRSTNGISFVFIPGVLPANTTTYTDNGRMPGTTYYYRVGALNACGNSASSNIASATTPP